MAKKTVAKVPVTQRALIQRINRKLAPGEQLRAIRGEVAQREFGLWCVFDTHSGNPGFPRGLSSPDDLENLARQLGVLKTFEKLA